MGWFAVRPAGFSQTHGDQRRDGFSNTRLSLSSADSPWRPGIARLVPLGAVLIGSIAGVWPSLLAMTFVATGIAIGLLVVLFKAPSPAMFLLALLVPISAGLSRGLVIPGLRPSEVLVVLLAGPIVIAHLLSAKSRLSVIDGFALLYICFTGVVGFLAARSGAAGSPSVSAIGTLLGPVQFYLCFRAVLDSTRTSRHAVWILRGLLLGSLVISLSALLQILNVGPTREVLLAVTDSASLHGAYGLNTLRATGLLGHWHSLAGYEFVILALVVSLFHFDRGRQVLPSGLLYLIGALGILALAGTLTFVCIAAFVVATLWLGIKSGRLLATLAALTSAVLALIPIVGEILLARLDLQFGNATGGWSRIIPASGGYRADVWASDYVPLLKASWLTGIGPEIPNTVAWRYTESQYITLMLRGGLPLATVFIALLLTTLSVARRLKASTRNLDVAVSQGLATIVAIMLVLCLANPYFTDAGVPHVLWILMGLGAALLLNARDGSQEIESRDPVLAKVPPPLERRV